MDFKNSFKEKLKAQKKGLEINSSPLSLFEEISKEYDNEVESNPILKFKRELVETSKIIKEKALGDLDFNIFKPSEQYIIEESTTENIIEDVEESKIIEDIIDNISPPLQDLISATIDSISKEEKFKSVKEHTDLFNQPNAQKPDQSIKVLQEKLKFLEDWVSKISMAGPGSGEVNFRWLDDVNRDTIGNTDQILRYNPEDKKFFFGQLSGDQGPIRSLEFDNSGTGIVNVNPGTLYWNTAKDCLNVYQNDDTLLQVGLENYIRVHNITGNTLTKGTFVQFTGVNGDGETPTCAPFLADRNSIPLYSIGLLAADIPHDGYGRACNLGEIRNIDATGSDVSEVWEEGDLLWASPTNPGKLTKVKPTAPDVVISVAAVIKANSIDGMLLSRPTIFPRLYYGSFYDTTTQTITALEINTPKAMKFSNTQISAGFHIANNSHVVAEYAGLYNYQFSAQIESTNAASSQNLWIWYRKNGIDVPNSATRISVDKTYKVAAWNFIESMEIGEYFELMWAADSDVIRLPAPPATAFCPAIPSVILTVSQINL